VTRAVLLTFAPVAASGLCACLGQLARCDLLRPMLYLPLRRQGFPCLLRKVSVPHDAIGRPKPLKSVGHIFRPERGCPTALFAVCSSSAAMLAAARSYVPQSQYVSQSHKGETKYMHKGETKMVSNV
jgi:hypothetical protein